MKRIMVIGGPGSGKSTLARRIGRHRDLPVVHLDQLTFDPGWVERPNDIRDAELADIVATQRWVMDGNYTRSWPARLTRTDAVIWIDIPVWTRLWRVLRRSWIYRGQVRPDLPPGCPEVFSTQTIGFLIYILRTAPGFAAQVDRAITPSGVPLYRFNNNADADAWVDRMMPPDVQVQDAVGQGGQLQPQAKK
ncbi:MAG: DNA topology modulation protein FlaR [Pseudomonadota bacterium]